MRARALDTHWLNGISVVLAGGLWPPARTLRLPRTTRPRFAPWRAAEVARVYAEREARADALQAAPVPSPDADQASFIRQRDNVDYLRQRLSAAEAQVTAAAEVQRVTAQALREAEVQATDLQNAVLVDEARRIEAELGSLAVQATSLLALLDAVADHFRRNSVVGRPVEAFGALRNRISTFWMGAVVAQADDHVAGEQLAALLRTLGG